MSPAPPFLQLPYAVQLDQLERLARTALTEHYGLDGAAVRMEVQQYEDNAVWRVTTPGTGALVARLSIRDGRAASQQRSEMRWLESIAAARTVAVPKPVATVDSQYVVPIDVAGHDEPATLALLHWLPGTAEPRCCEAALVQKIGSATAQLHQNSATVSLPEWDRPVWDAETTFLNGHVLGNPAARDQVGANGTATLRRVAELIAPALHEGGATDRGRIHADLHRGNIIALPDGGIGFIDFDDCGTGHYMLDIATALSSIYRTTQKEPGAYESLAHAFLAGYARIRALPGDIERLLEPYLLLRDAIILNFVTAAVPVNASVAAWGPGRIAGIVASMQKYLGGKPYPGVFN